MESDEQFNLSKQQIRALENEIQNDESYISSEKNNLRRMEGTLARKKAAVRELEDRLQTVLAAYHFPSFLDISAVYLGAAVRRENSHYFREILKHLLEQ